MTAAQRAAFESAAGVSITGLTLSIASVLAVFLLLWLAWIALAQFKLWAHKRSDAYDFFWSLLRAAIVTLVLGFLIR